MIQETKLGSVGCEQKKLKNKSTRISTKCFNVCQLLWVVYYGCICTEETYQIAMTPCTAYYQL